MYRTFALAILSLGPSMRVRLLAATVLLAAACGGSDSTTPPGSPNKSWDVYTLASDFSPNQLVINAGDTIRFNIVPAPDGSGHDVTFKTTPAGAPPNIKVTLNGVVPVVFTTRGTFHFDCFVHPGMSGDVVVQ
jgi:plastocyanin